MSKILTSVALAAALLLPPVATPHLVAPAQAQQSAALAPARLTDRDRQDILGRSGTRMSDIVKKVAESKGLDVVVDVSNTIYFKPALDITAEATAEYNKAFPAK